MVITVYSSEQCKIIYTNFQKLKDPMCWPIFTFPFAALYGLDCLILSFVVCLNGQINMMFSGLIFSYFVILTSSFRHRSLSVYQLRFITLDGVCAARVSAILHYMLNLNTLHLFTILVAAHTHTHTSDKQTCAPRGMSSKEVSVAVPAPHRCMLLWSSPAALPNSTLPLFSPFPLLHSAEASILPVISAEALTDTSVCTSKGCVKAGKYLEKTASFVFIFLVVFT